MAAQVQLVVIGWEIYQLTQDPLSLGLLGLSEVLPYLAVALYAGHVVDRQDRRKVSLAALVVLLGAAIALFTMALDRAGANARLALLHHLRRVRAGAGLPPGGA